MRRRGSCDYHEMTRTSETWVTMCNHDDKNLTDKTNWRTARTFTTHVNVHVLFVEGALGLGGLVVGVMNLHHAYAIPSTDFFPSGCCNSCCTQTLHSVIVNFICSQHREKVIWGDVFTRSIFFTKIDRLLILELASILPSHKDILYELHEDPDFVLINVHESVVDLVEVVHHLQEHDQCLFAEIR